MSCRIIDDAAIARTSQQAEDVSRAGAVLPSHAGRGVVDGGMVYAP